jgi:hypothetical protein
MSGRMREVTWFRNIRRRSRPPPAGRRRSALPASLAIFWLLSRFRPRLPSRPMQHGASPDDPDDGNGALRIVRSLDRPGAAAGDVRHLLTA